MHPTAEKVAQRLHERGLEVEVRELPDSTRTAAEAAAAIGCEVGQIVKSLLFLDDDEPVLCLWAGDRQVDTEERGFRRASADEVREATGFAIGGVPPLGHDRTLRTILDPSLDRFETLWCAAGTPSAVFEVGTRELVRAVTRMVIHDLNNQLLAIDGYAELLLRQLAEDDPARVRAERIHEAVLRAKKLTGQLLRD